MAFTRMSERTGLGSAGMDYMERMAAEQRRAKAAAKKAPANTAPAAVHVHACAQCGDPVTNPAHRLCIDCYRAECGY